MLDTTQTARTTQTAQTVGVGVADLQQAALAEARRLMREAGGDRRVATGLVFERLHDLGWVSASERETLQKMHEVGTPFARPEGGGKGSRPDATRAYLEVRDMYHALLTRGDASPVALVLAAGAVGSYEPVPGDDGTTVVYAKSNRSYQGILGGAGAIIGGAIGGAAGAAIGGAIGGVVGTIVDDCKD
jgi:hypothetical protein